MVWKDFLFGAVAVMGAEFLLALTVLAAALLHSRKASNRLLKAASKPPSKKSDA